MQVIEKTPDLRSSPSTRNLTMSYGEKGNTYCQWSDTRPSFAPQCTKQENHSLNMVTGDVRQSTTFSETWNRFASEESYTLRPQFPCHKPSPSPDSSETATPPSVSGSLNIAALHDSLSAPYAINSPAIDGFTGSHSRGDTDSFVRTLGLLREDTWSKNFGEYRSAPSYPTLGLGLNPMASSSTSMSSYDSAYSFSSHRSSNISGHNYHHSNLPGHLSPPPTASTSTSTSSGSSSPSLQTEFYDRRCGNSSYHLERHLYASISSPLYNAKQYAYGSDWQTHDGTAPVHNNYSLSPLDNYPSHSSSTSDTSNSVDGKKPKIRPRRMDTSNGGYEMGLAKSMIIGPTPTVEMMYRVKKKVTSTPTQPVLGMGLEDIDENEIEFTSRQDTKPTRLLRRQCYNCKTWRDVSAWRRSVMAPGHIVCNKCGLYEKAHKRSRPLNDRGEFVRPGKDPNPKVPILISPAGSKTVIKTAPRFTSHSATDVLSVDGASVIQFDTDEKDENGKDA